MDAFQSILLLGIIGYGRATVPFAALELQGDAEAERLSTIANPFGTPRCSDNSVT